MTRRNVIALACAVCIRVCHGRGMRAGSKAVEWGGLVAGGGALMAREVGMHDERRAWGNEVEGRGADCVRSRSGEGGRAGHGGL
jgi:hypothetical protein